MRPHIGAKKLVAATAALGVGLASVVMLTSGAAQATSSFGYSGSSHGTYVYVPVADSGPQVSAFFGCSGKVGLMMENKAASATASGETLAHTVKSWTSTHDDKRGNGTTSEGSAVDVKLGSLVKLLGVKTSASAVNKNGKFETSAGTKFLGVEIGGVKLPALLNPSPNTKVDVPGLGFIVFNWQVKQTTATGATASAAAVLIKSTTNNPFLKKGMTVAVLAVKATVGKAYTSLLRGSAYMTRAHVGDLVKSDPTSLQGARCFGTGGKKETVSVAGVNLPGLAEARAASSHQIGILRPNLTKGWMQAETAGVNLGNGKVKIGAISATATASKAGGKFSSSWSTEILSLVIDGKAVPVPKAPNQKLDVLGLGTITFNKVKQQKGYVSVTAIEVWVKALNTTVEIAHAESGIVS